MKPIILHKYDVRLKKNNIKITIEDIIAPDKCTAIDSAMLIIMTDNQLKDMSGWDAKADKTV